MSTKSNGLVSPVRHSTQCHAIWRHKYRSIMKTSLDKYSIQVLRVRTLVSLVQDGKVRYT